MTEAEIRKAINTNQAKYGNANDATKALLMAKNEGLAKQLDTLTGGKSTFDAASGRWALSGDNRNSVDRYLQQRELVANGAYGGYDASTDPAYSALKKSILRESDRSVEDTMGAYAGMTGGIPSTAAVTAAQETANYFRGQLADQQVALGEQDYNRWLNERNADVELMDLYASEAEASAANLAALGDFSAMGKLYGWNADQIAEAQRLWLAEQQGSGGRGRSKKEVEIDIPTYDNGMSDVKMANAAAKLFNQSKYGVNSAALDSWLANNGYIGNSAAAFKDYYGAMYDITGEKPNANDEKQNPKSNVRKMLYV